MTIVSEQKIDFNDEYKKTPMNIIDGNGNSWLWAAYNVPRIGERMRLPLSSGPVVGLIEQVVYDLTQNKTVIAVRIE